MSKGDETSFLWCERRNVWPFTCAKTLSLSGDFGRGEHKDVHADMQSCFSSCSTDRCDLQSAACSQSLCCLSAKDPCKKARPSPVGREGKISSGRPTYLGRQCCLPSSSRPRTIISVGHFRLLLLATCSSSVIPRALHPSRPGLHFRRVFVESPSPLSP